MSVTERKRAMEIGQALYVSHGDEQAKPRLTQALRWETKKAVGSRLGGFAGASVQVGTPGNEEGDLGNTVDGSKFYDPQFWDPEKYWAYTDKLWHNIGKQGRVTVGEVHNVSEAQLKEAEASAPQENTSVEPGKQPQ